MKHRCRASEAGSVEAGRPAPHRFFSLIASMGQALRQPNRASWGALERTEPPNRASGGARGSQIASRATPKHTKSVPRAPKSTPRTPQSAPRTPKSAPRTSQECPRASQERQIEAARVPRDVRGTHIEATRATLPKHCPCAAKSTKTLPRRSKIDAQGRPELPDRASKSAQERPRQRECQDFSWSSNFVMDIFKKIEIEKKNDHKVCNFVPASAEPQALCSNRYGCCSGGGAVAAAAAARAACSRGCRRQIFS